MRVTVLLFASYAEALGAKSVDIDLRHDGSVGELLSLVREKAGAMLLPPAMVAVNQEYAAADQVVRSGDEIAIIPPVAGG